MEDSGFQGQKRLGVGGPAASSRLRRCCTHPATGPAFHILFALSAVLILLACASPALAAGGFQVTDIPGSSGAVGCSAAEGRTVWSTGSAIYLHDSATDRTEQISNAWGGVYQEVIDGDDVVWVQAEPGGDSGHTWALYHYAIDSGKLTRLAGDVAETDSPARPHLKNGKVVWTAAEESSGSGTEIYLHDLRTHVTERLTNDSRNDWSPETDGTYVVWCAQVGDGHEILLYEIASGRTSSVAIGSLAFGSSPHIDEGHVVWAMTQPNGSQIYLYDIATGVTTQITDNDYSDGDYQGAPQISGGHVVWGARPGRSLDVFLYDIAAKTTIRLTNDGDEDRYPSIDGDLVAWWGGDNHDWEIFGYDISAAERFRLTSNEADDQDVIASDGTILWIQRESGLQTIMAAKRMDSSTPPIVRFPDVPRTHTAFAAVQALAAAGVVSGQANGSFDPDSFLLRAQAAKIVCEGLDLTPEEEAVNPFVDLGADNPESLYPHEYVAIAAERGIVRGTEPGKFTPWRPVTRAEFITMVVRSARSFDLGLVGPPVGFGTSIPTGGINPDHRANLLTAESNGLLGGVPGLGAGWDPTAPILRSEAAQVLWNLLRTTEPELW